MSNIFTRSPFKAVIDNGSTSSKVEIFIWNYPNTEPITPTKTLSKLAPSVSVTRMVYNVSPYIREYLEYVSFFALDTPSVPQGTNVMQWCNVRIKTYGNNILISDNTFFAFDGYTSFQDGSNYDLGNILLKQGTYYYWGQNPNGQTNYAGNITVIPATGWKIRYTDLLNSSTTTINYVNTGRPQDMIRVYRDYHQHGNKVEILDASDIVLATFFFRPIQECRYTPTVVDFLNRYGAWQREFFFKANIESIQATKQKFNVLQNDGVNYSIQQGQRRVFNNQLIKSIKVNSGIRDDEFAFSIQELIASEVILVNNLPATLTTDKADLLEEVNSKINNYTLDFEFAFDENNTVQ